MTNEADSIILDVEYENGTNFSLGATTDNLPPGVLYRVKATYKYRREDVDELSFDVGDIIRVVEYDDPEEQVCILLVIHLISLYIQMWYNIILIIMLMIVTILIVTPKIIKSVTNLFITLRNKVG